MAAIDLFRAIRNVLLTGLAVILPLIVTIYLIWYAIGWLQGVLMPFVHALERLGVVGFFERRELIVFLIDVGLYSDVIGFLSEFIALLLFLLVVVLVGAAARYRHAELLVGTFDYLIASIPAIGTVYRTLRHVGSMVLTENSADFEAVKLLRLFSEDTYVIAFQTDPSPGSVTNAVGDEDMVSLFVPMAPNPVTGGFLMYVPAERAIDVDLTVDQAARTILTSGISQELATDTDASPLGDIASLGRSDGSSGESGSG